MMDPDSEADLINASLILNRIRQIEKLCQFKFKIVYFIGYNLTYTDPDTECRLVDLEYDYQNNN
jgi:hypothetical protein